MRSIQTKISIVITVTVLATIAAFMIAVVPTGLWNDYSDRLLLVSARSYADSLNHRIEDMEGGENDLDLLRELASEISVYEDSDTFLLDKNGSPIYHTRYQNGISLNDMPDDDRKFIERVMMLNEDEVYHKQMLPGNELGKIIVERLDNGMLLGMSVPKRIIGMPLARVRLRFVVIMIILIILLISLGLLWVRSIIRPLKKMTVVADHYASGDYSEKIEVDSKDEVGRLSKNLQTMAESMTRQIEIADSANQAKSAFLSNMSHEIRTPITAVLGFNEMILRESKDAEILTYAENIKASGHSLLGLINDILDISKIEAGKIKIIPVDYDMTSVINDLVVMNEVRAREKGLKLILDIDRNIPRLLNGDEIRVKQIITNILTNAVKYTKIGSVTFSVGYKKIETEPDNVMIHVAVKDTGMGIRNEDLERIFSQFERIDEKNNRNIEGTGLGLNITKSLLEMMGSSLKVESVYGVGSVFSFDIKQKVVKWDPIGEYKPTSEATVKDREQYKSRFTAKNASVLIVDDNATNLLVFKNLIKSTLVRTDTAASGDDCLRMCKSDRYDIIFLDHMMPVKDGIETLHELKEMRDSLNADTPVICLTANAVSGAHEEYMREGFTDYLSKPIDPELLEEKMIEYLPKDKIDGYSEEGATTAGESAEDGSTDALDMLGRSGKINVNLGIKNCADEKIYLEVLGVFYDDIERSAINLDRYLKEEDIDNYVIIVHGVKSTSRTIGAESLGEKAADLERAGKEGDIGFIRDNHKEFMDEYMQVRGIISKGIGR